MFQIYSQIKRMIENIHVFTNQTYQILTFSLLLYLVEIHYTPPPNSILFPFLRGTNALHLLFFFT